EALGPLLHLWRELNAGDRRGPDRRAVALLVHRAEVVEGEDRIAARLYPAVEQAAHVVAEERPSRLLAEALVAGPAEVGGLLLLDGHPVDLLPVGLPDIADPKLGAVRPQRETERIAQAEGDDAPLVGIARLRQRVGRYAGAGVAVDADHGPVEPG